MAKIFPMHTGRSPCCLTTLGHAHQGQTWWRRCHSMLFGLPLAVSAFNCLPFLLQAVTRRCLAILWCFYFDDATAQDFDFATAHSQAFAETKRQTSSPQVDFLGIVHDLQDSLSKGNIPLWIRPRLIDKIHDLMDTAETYNSLPLGLSCKLFGCLGFLDQGAFGKVARVQYSGDKPYPLGSGPASGLRHGKICVGSPIPPSGLGLSVFSALRVRSLTSGF